MDGRPKKHSARSQARFEKVRRILEEKDMKKSQFKNPVKEHRHL